jgi:GTP pyrophosphokinase
VARLVKGVRQLLRIGAIATQAETAETSKSQVAARQEQVEALRKMLLAFAQDIRVVLVRLASRLQTLRWLAQTKSQPLPGVARETLDIYAPLANRLGIWQMKWELEDLAFRFEQPETYKRIAKLLDEKRIEGYISQAIARLQSELAAAGIRAEVTGRPKHIYSIWKKMRGKELDFADLYDVRAFRVIVDDIKDCYTVLGIVHHIWQPIPREFDDYISRPKANGYKSLHTVVIGDDGRAFEVQIRTHEMHHFAEYGVAAHWRYKEAGGKGYSGQFAADNLRREDRVAAAAAGVEGRRRSHGRARGFAVGAAQARGHRRPHLCADAAGARGGAAAGRHAGGFRLLPAQRPRPPLPRRASMARWCRSTRRSRTARPWRSWRSSRAGRRATG